MFRGDDQGTRAATAEAGEKSAATARDASVLKQAWQRLREPVSKDKRDLLAQRWQELPEDLRSDRQVVGQHLTHCGYTMGAAFCSFGCTHCYLPKNANQAPLPTLDEMKEQIDANRLLLGDFGALQVTGGDVPDAYWKTDRADELVEIIRYATDAGLVPMLMTHGQLLMQQPDYFDALVHEGGLRKVSLHIDMTQAGRAGYPIKSVRRESDLHPLRQEFVELVEGVQQRTGLPISAAHTVTVTEANISSIADIVEWMAADVRRMRVFRMLSLQPEADVGRTRYSKRPVTPEIVWQNLSRAVGVELSRDSWHFGHPDCSSVATVLVADRAGFRVNLTPDTAEGRQLRSEVLRVFGGVGSRSTSNLVANAQRAGLLLRHPLFLWTGAKFIWSLRKKRTGVSLLRTLAEAARGRAGALNLVMHNFMSEGDVAEPQSQVVKDRLTACSFRGAVKMKGGEWEAVPMCAMNSAERERIYDQEIRKARDQELVSLDRES